MYIRMSVKIFRSEKCLNDCFYYGNDIVNIKNVKTVKTVIAIDFSTVGNF